mmetsp:Transcript_102960/g.295227  ORF Transcript_102960/g.295227 Transcript_102960/m.295227 type:complete len:200 (+) Transcript_102960:95-694(+)
MPSARHARGPADQNPRLFPQLRRWDLASSMSLTSTSMAPRLVAFKFASWSSLTMELSKTSSSTRRASGVHSQLVLKSCPMSVTKRRKILDGITGEQGLFCIASIKASARAWCAPTLSASAGRVVASSLGNGIMSSWRSRKRSRWAVASSSSVRDSHHARCSARAATASGSQAARVPSLSLLSFEFAAAAAAADEDPAWD